MWIAWLKQWFHDKTKVARERERKRERDANRSKIREWDWWGKHSRQYKSNLITSKYCVKHQIYNMPDIRCALEIYYEPHERKY